MIRKVSKVKRPKFTYMVLLFITTGLAGCGGVKDSVEVVIPAASSSRLGEVVILNQNQFNTHLRKALIRVGFSVPPFASNSQVTLKNQETEVKFNKAEARLGIRHGGIFSAFNPCITNRAAANFKEYELEIIDLQKNQTLMTVVAGGWTENCPGDFLTMSHSTNLFSDLAESFANNYEKIIISE